MDRDEQVVKRRNWLLAQKHDDRFSLNLTERLHEALRREAVKKMVKRGTLVRNIVADYIARSDVPLDCD